MKKSEKRGGPVWDVARVGKALTYSLAGLRHAMRFEAAFRQEIALTCALIPLACLIPVSTLLKLLLIAANIGVLIVELLNTGIEAVVDKICPEFDPLAKQAKDMGAAAVFLSFLLLGTFWAVALWRLTGFE